MTYRVTVGGPSRTLTYSLSPDEVVHVRYAADPERPWRGNSPLQVAALAGRLSAETVNALADEASGPRGRLLGIPADGDDATVVNLKADIAEARGRVALIESGDWNNTGSAMMDLDSKRFGAEPPAALVELAELASREVYSACGLSPSLFQVGPAAALREAWRLALFGLVAPLGRLVPGRAKGIKLDGGITLSWQELRASDLAGRARAFQSLVNGGKSVQDSTAIAGLMVNDD